MSALSKFILNLLPSFLEQKLRNFYYENKISKVKESEEPDLSIVSRLVKNGDTCLDIGANFGLYTRFLSQYVGDSGKIHAFEPIEKTFQSLSNNVRKLKLKNTEVHNIALSDKNGEASMIIPEYEDGGENTYEARIIDGHADKAETVSCQRLDDFIGSNISPAFIKIDVEGHEISVLKGGKNCIEKNRPILLIEINGGIHKSNENAIEIVSFLSDFEYSAYTRKNNDLVKVTEDPEGFNYFFLTDKQAEELS